jgi:hypothetical protein
LNFSIGSGQLNRLDLLPSDGKQLKEIGSDCALDQSDLQGARPMENYNNKKK